MHFEIGLNRICSGKPQRGDEGFQTLMPDPPSIDKIAQHFQTLRKLYEVAAAREALRNTRPKDNPPPGNLG